MNFKKIEESELTGELIEKYKSIKDFSDREKLISTMPFVFPYVISSWKDDKQVEKLVNDAVELRPENITKLGKAGILPTENLVKTAVLKEPLVIFKINEDLKNLITKEIFIDAFIKNPLILTSDCKALKEHITRSFFDERLGIDKEISTTLRTECLKAIRLAEGVSRFHEGYDDFAVEIANKLIGSKSFKTYKMSDVILTKIPTVVNAMIKKHSPILRACPVETWKLNGNKTLYSVSRESAKVNSDIYDILADITLGLISPKVVKNSVLKAIAVNPKFYLRLDELGLGQYMQDQTVQFAFYKSCKKN